MEFTDIPEGGDYFCARSLYTWGCVHALRRVSDAYFRCNGDPQCRAMIVYPSLSKPGAPSSCEAAHVQACLTLFSRCFHACVDFRQNDNVTLTLCAGCNA